MAHEFKGPDGQTYDLSHVKFTRSQVRLKIENLLYDAPVLLSFSHHCYTDTQNADGSLAKPGDPWFYGTDDNGDHRVFCPTRYAASLALPAYLQTLMTRGLDCFQLKKANNFFRIHDNTVNSNVPNSKDIGWYIFFSFSRASPGLSLVKIDVDSHYQRKKFPDTARSRLKFKFDSLLAEWFKKRQDLFDKLLVVEESILVELPAASVVSSSTGEDGKQLVQVNASDG